MKKFLICFLGLALLLPSACQGEPISSVVDNTPPKKILVIGNSFSADALTNFFEFADDLGLAEDLTVGHLTIGGSSLETHDINAKSDANAYTYYKTTKEKGEMIYPDYSIKRGLADESWDLVTIQQVSGKSGIANSYDPYLRDLIQYIKDHSQNKSVKIGWHMTWAYQQDSTHEDFANYLNSQEMMYENIVLAVESSVETNDNIKVIIPSGTAIQNIRNSIVEDTVTKDGYHLDKIGKYVAGLTWIYKLYQPDLSEFKIQDAELSTDINGAIIEAVVNAVNHPKVVTPSEIYPLPPKEKYMDKLYLLSIGNSFTANAYTYLSDFLLDIGVKEFVVAYLYIGGSSLELHYNNAMANNAAYSYRKWSHDKGFDIRESVAIKEAIEEYDWDIITVQQVSQDSGNPGTYVPFLDNLIKKVKQLNDNPNTKYGFHMTWAYHKSTNHFGFLYYGRNQDTMYQKIVETTQSQVLTHPDISIVIPAGTAIQNVRLTKVGDNLTDPDGYHLNPVGHYISGMSWIKTITNVDLAKIDFTPEGKGIDSNLWLFKRAVNDAHAEPFKVTKH